MKKTKRLTLHKMPMQFLLQWERALVKCIRKKSSRDSILISGLPRCSPPERVIIKTEKPIKIRS